MNKIPMLKAQKSQGFTLVELMIAIAIIAIVASIALPSYLKYSTKAKVSEGLLVLDAIKVQIELMFYTDGYVDPAKFTIQTNKLGKYIDRAGVEFYNSSTGAASSSLPAGTTLWVRFNNAAAPIDNRCINLVPMLGGGDIGFAHADLSPVTATTAEQLNYIASFSQLNWECRTAFSNGVQFKFLPSACSGTNTAHTYCP